jgi:hypothetical protein
MVVIVKREVEVVWQVRRAMRRLVLLLWEQAREVIVMILYGDCLLRDRDESNESGVDDDDRSEKKKSNRKERCRRGPSAVHRLSTLYYVLSSHHFEFVIKVRTSRVSTQGRCVHLACHFLLLPCHLYNYPVNMQHRLNVHANGSNGEEFHDGGKENAEGSAMEEYHRRQLLLGRCHCRNVSTFIMMKPACCCVLLIFLCGFAGSSAFQSQLSCVSIHRPTAILMVQQQQLRSPLSSLSMAGGGGRGWDNNDYLSSLSGDEDDREQSREAYQDFSERRAAFQQRQQEYYKNAPKEAQAFLQQRLQQEQERMLEDGAIMGGGEDDSWELEEELKEGSGGGTRMSHMMAQAKRMQSGRGNPIIGGVGPSGFVQKLAVPLDLEQEEEEDNDKTSEEKEQ